MIRIGHGYDVHRLVKNRDLVLGGVLIPSDLGLLGHSDADVLARAVADAIMGAMALPDIGRHFPDSDPAFKGADSIELLKAVYKEVLSMGFCVINLDCTVIAEKPRLMSYIDPMREVLASALQTKIENVNVKATTEEGLGLKGEGIGAHAVVLLEKL